MRRPSTPMAAWMPSSQEKPPELQKPHCRGQAISRSRSGLRQDSVMRSLQGSHTNAILPIEGDQSVLSQISILGENPKIWYRKFNGLRTPKLPKKQICDRTPGRAAGCPRAGGVSQDV